MDYTPDFNDTKNANVLFELFLSIINRIAPLKFNRKPNAKLINRYSIGILVSRDRN